MANKYNGMTVDDLLAVKQEISNACDAMKDEVKLINEALELAHVTDEVSRMSAAKRAALAQVLQPKGIDSDERVGTPGRK